jgi:hypothetical protein
VVIVEGTAKEKLKMKRYIATVWLFGSVAVCTADDDAPASASEPAVQGTLRPRQSAPVAVATPTATAADRAVPAPKFVSEAKWLLAGYNNNEIVYTILVTNQDSMIIRCTTDMQGFYFENGQKLTISDRQVTTVFPNQATQVGTWMDMDESFGATYSVKCKPV